MEKVELSQKAKDIRLGFYENWQGKKYEVLGVGIHTETLEETVIYQAQYGENMIWLRPIDMFLGEKEFEDGKRIVRFKFIGKKQ